jgi:DNA modification methylase
MTKFSAVKQVFRGLYMIDKLEIDNQIVYFKTSEKMAEIEDNSITLVVTSPPYWNVRDYGDEQIGLGQSYQEYIDSMNVVWKECIRVLQPNGKISINVQPLPISSKDSGFNFRVIQNIMYDIEHFFRQNNCFLSGMHYWDKSVYISNVSWGSYPKPTNIASNTSFEQIFTFVKAGKTRKIPKDIDPSLLQKEEWRHWAVRCIWDDITPVIKINQKGENRFGHTAPFPEDIPYRLIRMHTLEGETVLDPFLGSGTTLKVARLTNRKGIGYETNPKYKKLIKNRILEDWEIPKIESGYKTIGMESLNYMFNTIIEETKTHPDHSKCELLSKIVERFRKQNLLTKTQKKKILES